MRAFGKNIVVKITNEEKVSKGGVVIPKSFNDVEIGIVDCVGTEVCSPPENGDEIMFSTFNIVEISSNEKEKYIVVPSENVLVIL